MTHRLHVFVTGRVQGVAFRYYTEREARRQGLGGWVRNLADGRVEAEFEGSRDLLEEMLAWCRQGPPAARVDSVKTHWEEGEARCSGFHLRH